MQYPKFVLIKTVYSVRLSNVFYTCKRHLLQIWQQDHEIPKSIDCQKLVHAFITSSLPATALKVAKSNEFRTQLLELICSLYWLIWLQINSKIFFKIHMIISKVLQGEALFYILSPYKPTWIIKCTLRSLLSDQGQYRKLW